MRRTILRRRAVAVAAAAIATLLLWQLLPAGGEDGGDEPPPLTAAIVSSEAEELLASLSAEEKVRELVLGAMPAGEPTAAIGGAVLVTGEAWPGDGGPDWIDAIRERTTSPVPPIFVTRQEGGVYRELRDLPPGEDELEIGERGSAATARGWAQRGAEALAAAGLRLNLAPVADVATLDSPIADRAFSDQAPVVARLIAATMRGCRAGGIACAPSHFPGLGGASQDTDSGPATVSVDASTLLTRDLAPFIAAFDRGAPAIVVSHAFYAAHDPVTPGSQSRMVLDELLRGELGFEGAAITDDLQAGAIRLGQRVPEAAVAAITAGADLVQIGDPDAVEPALRALDSAADAGTIPPERLDAAAGRALELKLRAGVIDAQGKRFRVR